MSRYADALQIKDHKSAWWTEELTKAAPSDRQLHRPLFVSPPPPPAPSEVPETDWLRAFSAVRKHWRLSAIFAGSVMLAVLLVTLLTKPLYSPVARVEVDPPGAELFNMDNRGGGDSAPDYLETQAKNMQSDQVLIAVTRQMKLDQVPEFTQRSFISRTISGTLSFVQDSPTRLWGKKKPDIVSTDATTGGETLNPSEASAFHSLQSQISVKRDTASRLINVSFTSHDPVLSAAVTNAVVRTFIDRSYETRHAAIMESTAWLAKQLDDIRGNMERANRELSEFQRVSGIADVDQNRSTFTEQMGELSRQKTQAEGERIQIESYLQKSRHSSIETLPQVQSNQVVQILTQRLGETRAELSQTLAVYGKQHPNAKKLQNQVDELESQIRLQQNAILGQMETSYSAALTREQMIDSRMRGTAKELGEMAKYTALKKDAQANSDLYNSLYARVKEAGIVAASKSINIRVVDNARVLDSPTSPKPLTNLGIGLFVAIAGGVFLAFGREALDTKVRTLEDVRRSLGVSTISMVPIAAGSNNYSILGAAATSLDGPAKFLLEEPGCEQSEAFRGIHTSVMLSQPDHPPQVLLVVSSVPGEGKSTVAVNLGIALAQQGRACILDADLRRPSIGKAFHLNGAEGLADYLGETAPLETVFSTVPDLPSLTIVGAGKHVDSPGRFIGSERMRQLIETLRKLFDFVIIDSPPILPYADGRSLAPFVDGIVFVGRAGEVTRDAMARSMELLRQVHSAPVLEVVLNAADTATQSYGRYKYYGQDRSA
jgi:capsular exopolysaccharide synthesis family protein